MDLIFLTIGIAYCLVFLVLFLGMLRSMSLRKKNLSEQELPSVTVIVSAKNEETNISLCMNSLAALDYPHDKLEIFLIDNDSTDNTGELMNSYAEEYDFIHFFRTESSNNGLRGKTQAIDEGITHSKGEIIFTTDADCCVRSSWIKETVKYYDNDTGVVNGFTLMETKNLFWALQSIDWLYMLSLCTSSAGLEKPISCVGNNMSYRRKAYEEVGGYKGIPFSVTEDFMLQKMIDKRTNFKTKFPVDHKCLNTSIPCLTMRELWRQKHRWGVGGLQMRPWGFLIGLLSWLGGITLLTGWIILSWKAYSVFLIVKLAVDLLFVMPLISELRVNKLLLYFIPFQIYIPIYSTILFSSLAFDRKVIWKKSKYN